MAGPKVKIIDRGWEKLKKEMLRTAAGRVAKVGVQGDEAEATYEDGWSNATNAAVHEFGTIDGKVPERAPMRTSFDENVQKYERQAAKSAKAILGGQAKTEGELLLLGEAYRADVLKKIKAGLEPGLAESTLVGSASTGLPRADYGDTPLMVTGQFWNSFSVQVVDLDQVER
jgi:hypothetical protein